jgi:Guanosine polyphosphate pyrophosphohydrolases/synthetases
MIKLLDFDMLKKLPIFERALVIATICHAGVKDRGKLPYILHPINVMIGLETQDERIVGILHDVIEDTGLTFADLRRLGFPEYIIEALDSVTHREDEGYMEYVKRAKANPIGRNVKKKDLVHNSDITRIKNPKPKDYERLEKYKKAYDYLCEE